MKTLIIAPCGARKLETPAPARSLYTGGYARACLAYALELARSLEDAGVLILSARYGLISLDEEIAPYNVTFGDAGAIAPAQLRAQLERLELEELADVRVIAGARYVAMVRELWPSAAAVIPAGMGLGHQLQWLKRATPAVVS